MAFTKVVGAGIHTQSNIVSHNINSAGIITATKFDGPFDNIVIGGGGLNISGVVTSTGLDVNGNGDISGNLVVGGNLTANGDFTTLNTTLREVELLRVDADSSLAAGIITQRGAGDIFSAYDTSTEVFKIADGGAVTSTGDITITNTAPKLILTDTDNNSDFRIKAESGQFDIDDTTSSNATRFRIYSNGEILIPNNVGFGVANPTEKIDVDGNIKVSGDATFQTANGNNIFIDKSDNKIIFGDNVLGAFGSDSDLLMHHTGSTGYIKNQTGNFYIQNDGVIIIGNQSSSSTGMKFQDGGPVELYWNGAKRFETGDTVNINSNHFEITSGQQLRFDNSNNNRTSEILNDGSSGNSVITFKTNGGNRWTIDSSGNFIPGTAGAVNIGSATAEIGDLFIADNKKAYFGSDQDFQVSHNGTHAVVKETTGRLYVLSDNLWFKNQADNSTTARFLNGDSVLLYYAGDLKLQTLPTGINVTGEVAASQDYPNFRPTLDFNFAAEKKLDPRIAYQRTGPASFTDEFGKVVLVGDNAPRFDHDPTTRECKGLLIEESRTNLFSGTANMAATGSRWSVGGSRGSQGANVEGPDGTLTAFQNVYNGTSGDLNISYSPVGGASELTTSNDTTHTFSVWAKLSAGASYLTGIRLRTYNQNISANFILSGSGSSAVYENQNTDFISSSIEEYPNDWYRCIMTFKSGTDGNQGFQIYLISGTNNHALNSSSANGESVSFWGVQLEEGSFATSFIPTSIDQESVTRGDDDLIIDGEDLTDFHNQPEGTIIADYKVIAGDPDIFYLSNNTASKRIGLYEAGSSQTRFIIGNSGTQADTTDSAGTTVGDNIKAAGAYKLNDVAASKNGVISSTDTSVTIPDGIDRAYIGGYYNGDVEGILGLRRLVYYQQRLPNSQLVTLTS